MRIAEDYVEKIYAGFLGMNMGIQLGAPVESPLWNYERLRATFGDIRGPIHRYSVFAADDDVNGPVFFMRSLYDKRDQGELTAQDVAEAWLNYTRAGRGMFWWGGYGISTEHTAYLNLKSAIPAPRSGSIEQNGTALAEQIGGQIFIDTWGLVFPGEPTLAADYAQTAASVSHDGEGLLGARFFGAAIAEAFRAKTIDQVMKRALAEIPEDSDYSRVVKAVMVFHEDEQEDFRACVDMVRREWGYERYPGNCPIIPNAGICALAMLYGNGDLGRTIEIAVMCGWDTDCNAGNVGTVLGVLNGPEGLPGRYREPIGDRIILSSACGSLNILDVPSFSKELACLGYRLAEQPVPEEVAEWITPGQLHFDFSLPGSVHGFRTDGLMSAPSKGTAAGDERGLRIVLDNISVVSQRRLWYKPYYMRKDFEDERYDPVFSPLAYQGQEAELELYLKQWEGDAEIGVFPYVRTAVGVKILEGPWRILKRKEATRISFLLPDTQGDCIDEVGIRIAGDGHFLSGSGMLYLRSFKISGPYRQKIDFRKQTIQFGSITPFSHNEGHWSLSPDGMGMEAMSLAKAQSYTGWYYTKEGGIRCPVTPITGEGHMLGIRVQGVMRGYYAGLYRKNKAAILKEDFGVTILAETDFEWQIGKCYDIVLTAEQEVLSLFIDGREILRVKDRQFSYGMFGCIRLYAGRCLYGNMEITGTKLL